MQFSRRGSRGTSVLAALVFVAVLSAVAFAVHQIAPGSSHVTFLSSRVSQVGAADAAASTQGKATITGDQRCNKPMQDKKQSSGSDANAQTVQNLCVNGCVYKVKEISSGTTQVTSRDTCAVLAPGPDKLRCETLSTCSVTACDSKGVCTDNWAVDANALKGKEKTLGQAAFIPDYYKDNPQVQELLTEAKTDPTAAAQGVSRLDPYLQDAFKQASADEQAALQNKVQTNEQIIQQRGEESPDGIRAKQDNTQLAAEQANLTKVASATKNDQVALKPGDFPYGSPESSGGPGARNDASNPVPNPAPEDAAGGMSLDEYCKAYPRNSACMPETPQNIPSRNLAQIQKDAADCNDGDYNACARAYAGFEPSGPMQTPKNVATELGCNDAGTCTPDNDAQKKALEDAGWKCTYQDSVDATECTKGPLPACPDGQTRNADGTCPAPVLEPHCTVFNNKWVCDDGTERPVTPQCSGAQNDPPSCRACGLYCDPAQGLVLSSAMCSCVPSSTCQPPNQIVGGICTATHGSCPSGFVGQIPNCTRADQGTFGQTLYCTTGVNPVTYVTVQPGQQPPTNSYGCSSTPPNTNGNGNNVNGQRSMQTQQQSPLQNLMRSLGFGNQQQAGNPNQPIGNQIAQPEGTCAQNYICQNSTLYARNSSCVDTPVQNCQYGCNGTQCALSPQLQCPPPPNQPDPTLCQSGVWQQQSNTNTSGQICVTGWQCVQNGSSQPAAQISCQPQVVDPGMSVAISYSCTNSVTSDGIGFFSLHQLSGSTTTVAQLPASGNTINYGIACVGTTGAVATSTCNVQVSHPSIVMVANPQTVSRGTTSVVGWVTTGMNACTVSSPDMPDFTAHNAGIRATSGVATTTPIATTTRVVLHCETIGGGTRDATTTITVANTSGSLSITSTADQRSDIQHGSTVTINWQTPGSPQNASISVWLYDLRANAPTALIAGNQPLSGSFSWHLPASGAACPADSPSPCASDLVAGRQYGIEAALYSPPNAYLGGLRPASAPDPHYIDYGYTNAPFTMQD
ncbi:MAG: hypothetical protein JO019_01105 [Candidatus Kaiserbacteria bacterium]|nr:hypothetical protein [Candidatus Kaiserbacteria bacterium]